MKILENIKRISVHLFMLQKMYIPIIRVTVWHQDKPRHDIVNISASKYHEHQGDTRKN